MKTIVFDLNGTLTESKQPLDKEMASLLRKILETGKYNVAVISGLSWKTIQKQFLGSIGTEDTKLLNNLYILASSGGALYQTWSKYGWIAKYHSNPTKTEIEKAHRVIESVLKAVPELTPEKLWGKQVEDRETQVTFSALGQKAPLEEKAKWDPEAKKRLAVLPRLAQELPTFEVKVAGLTSIDFTPRSCGRKFGIDELMQQLRISKDDIVYVGDSLFEGGCDYASVEIGLDNVRVSSIDDTKNWIKKLLG
jgi:hypothetical protein